MLSSDTASVRVGWIGLGTMGLEMARNLQRHRASTGQTPITVYNRTQSKCAAVVEHGAHTVTSPAQVADASDVVFLSLLNDQAVKSVVTEILDALTVSSAPLLIADTTTVHPDTTQWVLDQISQRQQQLRRPVKFCQTPVWGAPPAAKAAQLVFVVSAGDDNSALAAIAVPAFARTTLDCGGDSLKAARFKVLGNFMIGAIIESLGEAFAVAHETGVGRELYLDFVKEVLPVPPVLGYARKMVEENGDAAKTQVGFNVRGGMKDVSYAIDVAKSAGMTLPVAELAHEHLQWVLDNGDESWDWSSLAYALRKQ
ncbi:hypothetical protein IWW55_000253 [Coemansia sp. RSA 2706]|nr:hypothetical protein IWW55_000253 [Coemansia sp. RSA 2706]